MESSQRRYLVENIEDEIEQWCSLEYEHICQVVGEDRVVFTNILNSDIPEVRKKYKAKFMTDSIGQLKEDLAWEKAVLLDMDAEQTLAPGDAKDFELCVFGGILGNVPSDDRTAEVRKHDLRHARNLGPEQMTTNTAVLVTKIVLEDQVPLSDIPFVDDPEIPVDDKGCETVSLPFRYVSKSYYTKQDADRDTPVLPEGMLDYLKESGSFSLEFVFPQRGKFSDLLTETMRQLWSFSLYGAVVAVCCGRVNAFRAGSRLLLNPVPTAGPIQRDVWGRPVKIAEPRYQWNVAAGQTVNDPVFGSLSGTPGIPLAGSTGPNLLYGQTTTLSGRSLAPAPPPPTALSPAGETPGLCRPFVVQDYCRSVSTATAQLSAAPHKEQPQPPPRNCMRRHSRHLSRRSQGPCQSSLAYL
ncbi:hypothetical protein BESB_044810 [Besnoitia besnoiti]|uniref:SAM-dependent RNA methyltransferase n=1 Tax=Besnoitia besnoiti TaxID=94643 RepID=A0A2A9MEI6_BESBE|nr:hypothetical protein BESB_044810 [Besnoitia besnoiti]PFH36289.1 hypothetical protein BESB_044810 [Besnoitia besnoiti]